MFFFLSLFFPFFIGCSPTEQQAMEHYMRGIQATTYEEQNEEFNQTISLLLELQKNQKIQGDELLGDTFVQFREYPWALLYYYRLRETPEDKIRQAKIMGQLPTSSAYSFSRKTIESILSRGVFATLVGMVFLVFSWAIWVPKKTNKRLAIMTSLVLFIWSLLFFYRFSFIPLEGVLIQASGLYRYPTLESPQLIEIPLFGGSKIDVLQITDDGEWVKISANDLVGYLPTSKIRLI